MKNKELKFEEIEASHTLGGAWEGRVGEEEVDRMHLTRTIFFWSFFPLFPSKSPLNSDICALASKEGYGPGSRLGCVAGRTAAADFHPKATFRHLQHRCTIARRRERERERATERQCERGREMC